MAPEHAVQWARVSSVAGFPRREATTILALTCATVQTGGCTGLTLLVANPSCRDRTSPPCRPRIDARQTTNASSTRTGSVTLAAALAAGLPHGVASMAAWSTMTAPQAPFAYAGLISGTARPQNAPPTMTVPPDCCALPIGSSVTRRRASRVKTQQTPASTIKAVGTEGVKETQTASVVAQKLSVSGSERAPSAAHPR